jgi:hypothetical protein
MVKLELQLKKEKKWISSNKLFSAMSDSLADINSILSAGRGRRENKDNKKD